MIPIYYIISINYPEAIIGMDSNANVILVDYNDGKGTQISSWSVPNVPQPTVDQLSAFQTDTNTINTYQALVNTELNQPILQQLADIDLKSIRSIRENDTVRVQQWLTQAATLRAQLLPMTAAEVAATSTQQGT